MYNTAKARDRLKLSLEDLKRSLRASAEKDYPDAIFRIELAVQNACKAILSLLGVEYGATHFPSVMMGKILADKELTKQYGLQEHHLETLLQIATNASVLETQGATPRYGWETAERIVMPREIYDESTVTPLLKTGFKALELVTAFFGYFKLPKELEEVLQAVEVEIKNASAKRR